MFNGLTEFFTTPSINEPTQDCVNAGFYSNEPLFVVGMPRTGTTSVERILSKHSTVSCTGELQH